MLMTVAFMAFMIELKMSKVFLVFFYLQNFKICHLYFLCVILELKLATSSSSTLLQATHH